MLQVKCGGSSQLPTTHDNSDPREPENQEWLVPFTYPHVLNVAFWLSRTLRLVRCLCFCMAKTLPTKLCIYVLNIQTVPHCRKRGATSQLPWVRNCVKRPGTIQYMSTHTLLEITKHPPARQRAAVSPVHNLSYRSSWRFPSPPSSSPPPPAMAPSPPSPFHPAYPPLPPPPRSPPTRPHPFRFWGRLTFGDLVFFFLLVHRRRPPSRWLIPSASCRRTAALPTMSGSIPIRSNRCSSGD